MFIKLFSLVIAIVTPHSCLFAQTNTNNIDDVIQNIRANLSSFSKIEKANSTDGSRFVFIDDNDLKLIVVKAIEPNTEKNVEWYFISGQLAYCETNWIDTKTKSNLFYEKCYLRNGHLISWSNSRNKEVDPSSNEFRKMDVELVAYGRKIAEDALK